MPKLEGKLPVYAADGGYRIIQRTHRDRGQRFEALGVWRAEFDPSTGNLLGWRVVGYEARKIDSDLKSMPSTVSISSSEMNLNCEHSRTYGMREEQRLSMVKSGRAPEDKIERVKAKVRVYAIIGPAKQDILRVWPK